MRRRTYAIFTVAVVSTFGLLMLLNERRSPYPEANPRTQLKLASKRLCQALEASHRYLDSPPQGRAPATEGQRRLLRALATLGLTAGSTPPDSVAGSGPLAPPPSASLPSPAEGKPPASGQAIPCPVAQGAPAVLVIGDPAKPEELWLTSSRPPKAGLPRRWLKLETLSLLDGTEGRIQVFQEGKREGAPRGNHPWQRVWFEGLKLRLSLPQASPGATIQGIDNGLAWSLFAVAMVPLAMLGFQSRKHTARREQMLQRLRTDRQTGLLSRLALEQDLQNPKLLAETTPQAGNTHLLVMVTIRLLERQRAFLQDEEISRLFEAISLAVQHHPQVGRRMRCYRASENRLAVLFPASAPPHGPSDATTLERDGDRCLLEGLQEKVSRAIQAMNQGLIRNDDILITGQRLRPGKADASLLRLHGFGEIVAAEAGSNTRLLEATDMGYVNQAAALRDALSQLKVDDIDLVFQPILLLHNPGHFGVEVLIRFRPPLLRERSTGELIDLAHTLGITHQIDALVIAKVGKLQLTLDRTPLLRERIEYLSINISNDSVCNTMRLEQLIGSLRKHRIDSSRICLEFTETPGSGSSSDPNPVSTASERLIKELNFRILIDDFGSGLSNYQRICEAWYDTIKLDIDLVSGLGDSLRMQRYLGSFIEAVHALGKTVVAEGVEDHADLAAAIRLGTDGLQGYLISRPLAWGALESFLRDSTWSSAREMEMLVNKIKNSDRLLEQPAAAGKAGASAVPLERFILDKWYELRSFEEFLLLFVNELKSWGLDILRLSLAFLPDEDDIDCSQYVWWQSHPGDITTLRMDRAFLEQEEHLSSPLHHIACRAPFYRQRLGNQRELGFSFLSQLKDQNCSDYLGIRLDSRGISIPVLTIALRGGSSFSDEQIQRICSMSSLLSLLFYTFESERAKRLALLDPLTNLPNRRSFDSFFKALVTAARINNTRFALALLDIDRFKQVNDTMGHAYGDRCLRKVATVLESILRRNNDIVARLGGEEFALILPDTDGTEAMRIGERLRQAVHAARVSGPDDSAGVSLTISLGIAIWDPASSADCDVDQLLQLADDCLYEAKRQGRNRVVGRQVPALSPKPAGGGEPGR